MPGERREAGWRWVPWGPRRRSGRWRYRRHGVAGRRGSCRRQSVGGFLRHHLAEDVVNGRLGVKAVLPGLHHTAEGIIFEMRGAGERIKFGLGDETALIVVGVGEAGAVGERHGGLAAAASAPNGRCHTPRKVGFLDDVPLNIILINRAVNEMPRAIDEGLPVALHHIADAVIDHRTPRGLSRDGFGGLFVQEGNRLLPRFPIQGVGVTLHVLEAS